VVFLLGSLGLSKERFRRRLARRFGGDDLEIASVAASKVSAGVWFAVTSLAALTWALPEQAATGWSLHATWRAAALLAVVSVISLAMVARSARTPAMRERYPEARLARWTTGARAAEALGWLVYLYGYELLFRGVLLYPLVATMPVVIALAVHSSIYALAHLDKPLLEILGTLPMGFVFGWLAIETGSVLPGAALHATIALTNSYLCSRPSPGG
jgi:membrane protease YdiL (CAAX protease family)